MTVDDAAIGTYVALGDSFTLGLGDPDPRYPKGMRGWSERVAEQLAARNPRFRYSNLAVRGHCLHEVEAHQLPAAERMAPDLVTICAGYPDLVALRVNYDELARRYDSIIARLVGAHVGVIMFTGPDAGWLPVHRCMRGRAAVYAEIVREIADRHGAEVVDFWRLREYRDLRMWDRDRMHLSPRGHRHMAKVVLDLLELDHGITEQPLPPRRTDPVSEHLETLNWVGGYLTPWLGRHLRGVADTPAGSKRPTLQRVRVGA